MPRSRRRGKCRRNCKRPFTTLGGVLIGTRPLAVGTRPLIRKPCSSSIICLPFLALASLNMIVYRVLLTNHFSELQILANRLLDSLYVSQMEPLPSTLHDQGSGEVLGLAIVARRSARPCVDGHGLDSSAGCVSHSGTRHLVTVLPTHR